MENVHFNMKGTPSAAEVELLIYLLEQKSAELTDDTPAVIPNIKPSPEGLAFGISAESDLPKLAERTEKYLERLLNERTQVLTHAISLIEDEATKFGQRIQQSWKDGIVDEFFAIETRELLDQLTQNAHDPVWCQALQRSYLSAFVKHQPQYRPEACVVVSGSSRTALGILGFHCGITDVVIPDAVLRAVRHVPLCR
jgi:hypothetical protein